MKTYQFADRTIRCGPAKEWEELVRSGGDQSGTVIDLRTFLEVGDQMVPKPPEGWGYRRLPLTGATVSEQDLDVFRREFYRKPQTVVVGPTAVRGSLMVAASIARLEKGGFDYTKRSEGEASEERELLEWLTLYLVRHGFEPEFSRKAIEARSPAKETRPKPSAPVKPAAAEKPAAASAEDEAPRVDSREAEVGVSEVSEPTAPEVPVEYVGTPGPPGEGNSAEGTVIAEPDPGDLPAALPVESPAAQSKPRGGSAKSKGKSAAKGGSRRKPKG